MIVPKKMTEIDWEAAERFLKATVYKPEPAPNSEPLNWADEERRLQQKRDDQLRGVFT